jgi:invasion protein IalB
VNCFKIAISVICVVLSALSTAAWAQEETPPKVETAEAQVFSDWSVACDEGQSCQMSQAIVQPATRRLILQIKVFTGKEPTALLTFPLGILLSTGWQYDIDGKSKAVLPFEICNTDGCHAGIKLTPKLLAALKRGSKMKIRFFDAGQTEVAPEISLIGFTKAYEATK